MITKKDVDLLQEKINFLFEKGYDEDEVISAIEYIKERNRLLRDASRYGWDYISKEVKLPKRFIYDYADNLNWDLVSLFQDLEEPDLLHFTDKINWSYVFLNDTEIPEYMLYDRRNTIKEGLLRLLKSSNEFAEKTKTIYPRRRKLSSSTGNQLD